MSHGLAAVEILTQTIKVGDEFGTESKTALRDLTATVTVHPAEVGTAPEISIEGRLTKLVGGDHFPTRRVGGDGGS